MDIELRYTQNAVLKKYIHCYYDAAIEKEKYIAFPNYYIPTCIIKDATLTYVDTLLTVKRSTSSTLSFYGANIYKTPIKIQYEGNFQTFNIVFKSYGLAQFTNESIDFKKNTLLDYTSILQPFFEVHSFFSSYSFQEKINTIEQYLLSVLSVKNHTEEIIKRVDRLTANSRNNKSISIKSDKTIYRAFKNICGASPGTIYNVIRLRKAMHDIIEQKTNGKKLVDIAHSLDFFDQAHFTKYFKKLAQKLPKDFFTNLTYLSDENDNENIFFEFIKNVQ